MSMNMPKDGKARRSCGIVLAILMLAIVSCASNKVKRSETNAVRYALTRQDTGTAVARIEEMEESYGEDHALYSLDHAMVLFRNGQYAEASKAFADAERIIDEEKTKSVSKEVASYLLNDYSKVYSAEDYEDVYSNVFASLCYYLNGEYEDAMVEVRRVNTKLKDYANNTRRNETVDFLENAIIALSPSSLNRGNIYDLLETEDKPFTDSNLARYLAMLFYRGEGLEDDARIEAQVLSDKGFAHTDAEVNVPRGQARLNVLSLNNLIALKEEVVAGAPAVSVVGTRVTPVGDILTRRNFYHRVVYPAISPSPYYGSINSVEVILSDGRSFRLGQVESVSDNARQMVRSRAKENYLKSYFRGWSKVFAAVEAGLVTYNAAAQKASGIFAKVALAAAERAFYAGIDAVNETEKADLRMAGYFPDTVSAGGINVDPGVYDVTVKYDTNKGVFTRLFKNVNIEEGKLNLLVSSCVTSY